MVNDRFGFPRDDVVDEFLVRGSSEGMAKVRKSQRKSSPLESALIYGHLWFEQNVCKSGDDEVAV